jgi:polyisoprenoid-binding protein YceI
MHRWIATVLLLASVAAGAAAQAHLARVAPESKFEFSLHTRWAQTLQGRFAGGAGEVVDLGNGKRQVRLRLPTNTVEIVDHPRYTQLTRGPRFFDAARFPDVQFISDPYDVALLRDGGTLFGQLRMHGIQRREHFVLSPGKCARPGRDCAIHAQGVVRRGDYDLDGWRMALKDDVRFDLQVRLNDVPGESSK